MVLPYKRLGDHAGKSETRAVVNEVSERDFTLNMIWTADMTKNRRLLVGIRGKIGREVMKKLVIIFLSTLFFAHVNAEERNQTERIAINDPTVAKEKPISGIYIDALYNRVKKTVTDSSGNSIPGSSSGAKAGFSGYWGEGDTTYLFTYQPSKADIGVGNNPSTNRITSKTTYFEFDKRVLDRTSDTSYVPYELYGVAVYTNDFINHNTVVNGITSTNEMNGLQIVYGRGWIIPKSEIYGYRLELKLGVGYEKTKNIAVPAFNKNEFVLQPRASALTYVNLTKTINMQTGIQYNSQLEGFGIIFQIGSRF